MLHENGTAPANPGSKEKSSSVLLGHLKESKQKDPLDAHNDTNSDGSLPAGKTCPL